VISGVKDLKKRQQLVFDVLSAVDSTHLW